MIDMTKQEEIRWEWVKTSESDDCETYILQPFTVVHRAFVYSYGEIIWLAMKP